MFNLVVSIYAAVPQGRHQTFTQPAVLKQTSAPSQYRHCATIAPLQPVLFNKTHTIHLSPTTVFPPTADISALLTSTALHNS